MDKKVSSERAPTIPKCGGGLGDFVTAGIAMFDVSRLLADKAIATFNVRQDNIEAPLAKNPILVTALNPVIGYNEAARVAKVAYQAGRPILDVAEEETELSREELERLLDPAKLTAGGIQ